MFELGGARSIGQRNDYTTMALVPYEYNSKSNPIFRNNREFFAKR